MSTPKHEHEKKADDKQDPGHGQGPGHGHKDPEQVQAAQILPLSINEPPGSDVEPPVQAPKPKDEKEASPPVTETVSHETLVEEDDEGDEHGYAGRHGRGGRSTRR